MTMTKYTCALVNPETGERRVVVVELDDWELDDIKHNARTATLIAKSYVMKHASRLVPGADPDLASIKQIQIH
jgi:hypothetical protein